MQDLSGRTFRGYELRERIGAGGFGAVYRAFQHSVNREVAVKVILPERANNPEFVKRFETEAQFIAKLDHLHIVPLYEFWREDDGSAFLAMRWLRGGSLRTLVRSNALSLETAFRIIDQIADALTFAHARGIIHRDIKPDNILLDEQRNAYLSDFGIAKDTVTNANITSTDSAPGTPAYAAPEQVGGGVILPQADVYALGMTLYEMLTGEHPFPASPMQHLYEPLPSVAARRRDVPVAIDEVILRATAKRINERYRDARVFVTALHTAMRPPQDDQDTPTARIPSLRSGIATPPLDTATDQHSVRPSAASASITPARRDVPVEQSALLIRTLNDIPSRPERLIGRDLLLEEIGALLDRGTKVLLQGLGGMGKTSLAAETVARRIQATSAPIVWLRASGDDGEALLIAMARPFEAQQAVALAKGDAQAGTVRQLLKDNEIALVVLDDAWDGKALKRVVDALPPGLPTLITSRQRFPVGKILDVSELDNAQALELLNFHASETFTLDDADAVELCERLGNHPFTLEIAGKTLQVDGLTPAELIARIAEAPHLLEMPEGYAAHGRSSVNELLNDSVVALDVDARRVFLAFGAFFVPEVTLELLASAMHADPKQIDVMLTTLARRGLTRREHSTQNDINVYTIHDLAFSYARAAPSIERRQVIAACRAFVTAHVSDFKALDVERSNILKAAEAAFAMHDHDALIAIMRALTVDGNYFNSRGHDALLLACMNRAVEAARMQGDAQAETLHYFLSRRGNAHYNSDDMARAMSDYQEALEIAERLQNIARQVILRCVISKIHSDRGEFEKAETHLAHAHEQATTAGDDLLIARVLEHRGYHFAEAKKDYQHARDIYLEQVQLAEKLNDSERLFFALHNLGATHMYLNEPAEALPITQRSVAIAEKNNNHLWEAHSLLPLGMIYHALGRSEDAKKILLQSLRLFRKQGNTRMMNEVENHLAEYGYATS
jgi:serine/threonine-protein kinase